VRIRGCNVAGCNVGLGSGVIIHSSGVILTANHVTLTDPRNPLSPRLEDFIIEVTDNVRQSPQARYRARLLAAKPEADLALLGIYWDEAANQPLNDPGAVTLSNLPIADVNAINLGGRLHILGYPLAGGAAINYTEVALGGFDENGALLKVNASLNEGYSGGPVLVEQDGRYAIAGVVILRRADVSFIRSIDQLSGLTWEPTARRVWADNVQVSVQGSEANATLQISADIHALDYVNHKGRVLASNI
jgi:S1-C subfamily serine protease